MIQGGPRKTSSRSLVDVGIQRDVILMSGILEIFLSESPYPSNSLQLRHTFAAVRKISNGKNSKAFNLFCTPCRKRRSAMERFEMNGRNHVVSQTLVENPTL
jgi:hypothetical protein